jgi:hypothetical protein
MVPDQAATHCHALPRTWDKHGHLEVDFMDVVAMLGLDFAACLARD